MPVRFSFCSFASSQSYLPVFKSFLSATITHALGTDAAAGNPRPDGTARIQAGNEGTSSTPVWSNLK
jgi:hypothetical protein